MHTVVFASLEALDRQDILYSVRDHFLEQIVSDQERRTQTVAKRVGSEW